MRSARSRLGTRRSRSIVGLDACNRSSLPCRRKVLLARPRKTRPRSRSAGQRRWSSKVRSVDLIFARWACLTFADTRRESKGCCEMVSSLVRASGWLFELEPVLLQRLIASHHIRKGLASCTSNSFHCCHDTLHLLQRSASSANQRTKICTSKPQATCRSCGLYRIYTHLLLRGLRSLWILESMRHELIPKRDIDLFKR